MKAQPFPGPPMQPTAFRCDGCGIARIELHVHRRPNGDEHWLCIRCQPRAFGSVPVDVVAQHPQQLAECGRSA